MHRVRHLLVLLLLLGCLPGWAQQTEPTWRQLCDELMVGDGDDTEAGELLQDSYELLEQLAGHPFDLNRATRDDLEQLPFLSAQQVEDLQAYLYRYGPMRSLGELRMVRSLDYVQLSLLPFFVRVDSVDAPRVATAAPRVRPVRQTLSATLRVPFYERRGDRNGYLGYPYRHTLRYELSAGRSLRAGLVAAQDAGEPFFAKGNAWGYDAYSYYVQLRQWGRLENFVAGKYKLQTGMGLVLGQSFSLGKLATLQSLGRVVQTVRPHASRSEADYFRGAAATVGLRRLSLTAFASLRPFDATLTADGDAQTLLTDGYHRTPAEMQKKANTHMAAGGAHVAYRYGSLRLGATVVGARLDRSLQPQRQTLYRRHYAHGSHFCNVSADYAYTTSRLAFSGETATDGHGALATANTLSFQPTGRLALMALQRFYSYRYTSLFGHAFAAGSRTQNESGLYVGASWNPVAHLRVQAYADYAYFPWARYQASFTSRAWDFLAQATYRYRRWTLQARHRSQLRQRDNASQTALTAYDDHRERLSATYDAGGLVLKTQVDLARTVYKEASDGWMLSQQATVGAGDAQLSLLGAWFRTDSYQSRIYLSERQLPHEFYFPTYYGHGLHLAACGRVALGWGVRLSARAAFTRYFDRSTIGSGLQQIDQRSQTDVDVQLSWRF